MKKITLLLTIVCLLCVSPAAGQQIRFAQTDTTSMMAPGNSTAVFCGGGRYTNLLWLFTISSIDDSLAVALQAKIGNSDWVSVWADSISYDADGVFGFEWDNVAIADSIRFRWFTEAGGTAAMITHNVSLIGGN